MAGYFSIGRGFFNGIERELSSTHVVLRELVNKKPLFYRFNAGLVIPLS